MKLSNFSFLKESISILLILKDVSIIKKISCVFQSASFYKIETVEFISEAKEYLYKKRYHICILDNEFRDFSIIKEFPFTSFVIMVSKEIDCHDAFNFAKVGVKILIDQYDINSNLLKAINRLSVINLINPVYKDDSTDRISIITKALIEKRPKNSTEWARECKITDRQLRHLWNIHFKIETKIVLFIYRLYDFVLNGTKETLIPKNCDQLITYFLLNKNKILGHINNKGNIEE